MAVLFYLLLALFNFEAQGMATHQILVDNEKEYRLAEIGEKEIKVEIERDSIFISTLSRESFLVDEIMPLADGIHLYVWFKQPGCSDRAYVILGEDGVRVNMFFLGEKHIFTMLTNEGLEN